MMMLRYILLFLACVCTYGQKKKCDICIVDSICDDTINFNLSISETCEQPVNIYYSYDTEIHSGKRYFNATINCQGCYFEIDVAIERDAWEYTLTIESPKSTNLCSVHTARCGGSASLLLWYITGGLSGLFGILGVAACIVRCFHKAQEPKVPDRKTRKRKITERDIQAAVINV
jgi:hypothetical protein